ncbi:MAG: class GN sortase [Glaciecola sp.]
MNINWQKALGVSICLIGLALLTSGFYIQLKAQMAQLLIAHAYQQQRTTNESIKPWPWADTHVAARIKIKHQWMYVLFGASARNLAFGPTVIANTSLPGTRGNSVVVGHRDTHFEVLQHVHVGERIKVERNGTTIDYEVIDTAIVDQSSISVTAPLDDTALTLITCYPFNDISPNPKQRFVVRAIKIS